MSVVLSIIALCLIIFVHELGHFLFAKMFNVGVVAFSIGFGPTIYKKRIGETTYSIRLLPLGGYVRMAGDDPRALVKGNEDEIKDDNPLESISFEDLSDEQKAVLMDRSRWLLLKPFWQKFFVVFGGPLFNFIFAVVVGAGVVYLFGKAEPVLDQPIIGRVIEGHPADKVGIRANDKVIAINGTKIRTWEELAKTIKTSGGKTLVLTIERESSEGKKTLKVAVTPEFDEMGTLSGELGEGVKVYRIGIAPKLEYKPATFYESIVIGASSSWFIAKQTVLGLVGLITGKVSPYNIAGPIRILEETGKSASKGLSSLMGFLVFISVSLGILNLLPIPVLDGGHIMFFIIEAIKGKPVSLKTREITTQIGMAFLLSLMIFAIGNDLFRN